jgi:hypothetical protein
VAPICMWLLLIGYQWIILDMKKTELGLLTGGATQSLKVAENLWLPYVCGYYLLAINE